MNDATCAAWKETHMSERVFALDWPSWSTQRPRWADLLNCWLREHLRNLIEAPQDLLAAYLGQLIPAIQQAIIDDDESVRNQASTDAWQQGMLDVCQDL